MQNAVTTNLHPIILKLLKQRGHQPDDFFSWDLNSLPDFSSLKDIKKSAQRVIQAIQNQEAIGIYGDYDVDGTTACALFFHFFKLLNVDVKIYQPSRFIEGYGIHPPAINNAKNDGIKLLITVDCGITNNEAATHAKELDIDLIITDHHTDGNETMPDAFAIVNPNRRDEPISELKSLAGVGVAFALAWEIKKELEQQGHSTPSLYPLLQFVAIGTICDLAKLTPMNLKLVRHGLKQLPKSEFVGLKVFLTPEERQLPFLPSEKLAFQIGPKINAKGRLDKPQMALDLLISNNLREAEHLHRQLEISNQERKIIQKEVFLAAKEMIKQNYSSDHLISIVYHPDWHEGVIGIVASKLTETFGVPAIVFTNTEDPEIIKASARSAGEFDLFAGLNECRELFIRFGGHKAAAGLSMPKQNLPLLRQKLQQILQDIPAIIRTNQQHFDLEISADDITPHLVKQLEHLEPFGMGNEKPVFKINDFYIESFREVGKGHIKWELRSRKNKNKLNGISFNYFDKWNIDLPENLFARGQQEKLEAIFTLGINHFNGNSYLQLYIDRIQVAI